jgi:DNA topoisomerase IB
MSTVFLLPGVAGADGALAAICNPQMQEVFAAIDNGNFLGRVTIGNPDYDVRDQQRMHDKWHEAVKKLDNGKFDDADEKLSSIRDKASDLVEARNAKLLDDTRINAAVGAALACIP